MCVLYFMTIVLGPLSFCEYYITGLVWLARSGFNVQCERGRGV